MSQYRRAAVPGGSYFFTVVTYRRRPILCDDPVRAALRAAIAGVRDRHPFRIDAWVLLPDHLHCLWTLPPGDADYSLRWNLIKRSVSLACAGLYRRPDWMSPSKAKRRESTFWQRRYWEHCIRNEADFSRHIAYIYFNPVRHGMVERAADWPFSTFHRDVARGLFPQEWGMGQDAELPSVGEPC